MTVKDEAATTLANVPASITNDDVNGAIYFYYPSEASSIVSSDNYNAQSYVAQDGVASGDEARAAMSQFCTYLVLHCSFRVLTNSFSH